MLLKIKNTFKKLWDKIIAISTQVCIKTETWLTEKVNYPVFLTLSFSWGAIMSIIGAIVVGILRLTGKEVKKHGYCWYVEVNKPWGLELGCFFLAAKGSTSTRNHEHGHALQNIILGPLMPFVVCIPSAIRFWYREIKDRSGNPCETDYDAIWFEGSATRLGEKFIANHDKLQQ